jgi:hypothetical protein
MQFQVQRDHDDLERNQHSEKDNIENDFLTFKFKTGKGITGHGIQKGGTNGNHSRKNNGIFYIIRQGNSGPYLDIVFDCPCFGPQGGRPFYDILLQFKGAQYQPYKRKYNQEQYEKAYENSQHVINFNFFLHPALLLHVSRYFAFHIALENQYNNCDDKE